MTHDAFLAGRLGVGAGCGLAVAQLLSAVVEFSRGHLDHRRAGLGCCCCDGACYWSGDLTQRHLTGGGSVFDVRLAVRLGLGAAVRHCLDQDRLFDRLFLLVVGIHAMLKLPLHLAYFLLPTGLVMGATQCAARCLAQFCGWALEGDCGWVDIGRAADPVARVHSFGPI